jgi:hypothetical protein
MICSGVKVTAVLRAVFGAAIGETWVASKPGGLNVRNSDDLEIHPARSLFADRFGEADPLNLLGKAADVGEGTGRCTLQPDGIMAQASWERLAEVTSGRISSQQGLAATCKDLGK